jgi:hypothetical protein
MVTFSGLWPGFYASSSCSRSCLNLMSISLREETLALSGSSMARYLAWISSSEVKGIVKAGGRCELSSCTVKVLIIAEEVWSTYC